MYICIFTKELSELSEEFSDNEEQLNQQEPKKAQEENIGRK